MPSLWTLGGLSVVELGKRTARESWNDAVFGQGGRMAFYQFIALFPALLVLLVVAGRFAFLDHDVKSTATAFLSELFPQQVCHLLQAMTHQLTESAASGVRLLPACLGAAWAAFNATWAMVVGLNTAYEVKEQRSPIKLFLTIAGLTVWLAVAGALAIFILFLGVKLMHIHQLDARPILVCEWITSAAIVMFSLELYYRFAPNLRDVKWSWSTPGAALATVLWLGATAGARIYFEHIDDYARAYGHLNSVIMLLLWLYVTNGAILIGGEMNSEIEKAAAKTPKGDRSGS